MKKGVAIRRARVEQSRGEVWSGQQGPMRKRKLGSSNKGRKVRISAASVEEGAVVVDAGVAATRATTRATSRRHQQCGEEEGAIKMTAKW
ncbi:hypothetical protein B296_00051576 [Ensete ventricosum]|uniref:Uncharacterized protein n=1 Tax=Ensete ventricosum TaxID=4639 RepID=A0A426XGC4_ENSVE|nr:hypothetical protein B296_00051576 [Ensete ventricosum]